MKKFCVVILACIISIPLCAQQESIEKILDESGAVKTNADGSFHTAGYQMTYGRNNEPIFKKTNSLQKTAAYTWGSLGSGRNGTIGDVFAIAVDASGYIYVGGSFTLAGDVVANNIAKWDGTGWSALGSGAENGVGGTVNAIAISGANVYVGGNFTYLGSGSPLAKYLAAWNSSTSSWSTFPSGSSNGVNNTVYALAVDASSNLYVGGRFTFLGDGATTANRIAKWAGSGWSTLTCGSSNGVNNTVYALAVLGNDLYVGGYFTLLGDGTPANRIIKWDGSNWSPLTSGAYNGLGNNYVWSIAAYGAGEVLVGGSFTSGTGTPGSYILKWNPTASTWSTLSSTSHITSTVYTIAVNGTNVYVGGIFVGSSTPANRIAKWDGSAWSTLPSGSSNGVNNTVRALATNTATGIVYVGGQFTALNDGTTLANYITSWNGTSWSSIGSGNNGINGVVNSVAAKGTDVYVGGNFTTVGDATPANYIAKWNGAAWSSLGSGAANGVNGIVYSIVTSGNNVYAGGAFTTAGDQAAANIAMWKADDNYWINCANRLVELEKQGVGGRVNALTVAPNGNIYVGGNFTTLGDGTTSAKYLAKWDPAAGVWSTLPSGVSNGVNNNVNALIATPNGYVYVGGNFTTLGDGSTSTKYIAKWDPTTLSWSTLPCGSSNGVNNTVNALTVDADGYVYVGGVFTGLGDGTTSAYYIAKWNSAAGSWSTLPYLSSNGVSSPVNALAASGTDIYVGGTFDYYGNYFPNAAPAKYIAKWTSSGWTAIGSGVSSGSGTAYVNALHVGNGKMYMGGNFNILNKTTGAFNVGTFTDSNNPLPVELTSLTAFSTGLSVVLEWTTATEADNAGFDVERRSIDNGKLTMDNWNKIGFVEGHGTTNAPQSYTYTDKQGAGKYSYRLKQIDRDGKYEYSGVVTVETGTPAGYELKQNYPNPFNPATTIAYRIPADGFVSIKLFDVAGREVAALVNENKKSGSYEIAFDGSRLSSGMYICRMSAAAHTSVTKMTVLK